MTEGFQHAIAGGQGKLVIAQLQSPNFQLSPLTGWAILKNGQAYFASIVLPPGTVPVITFAATAPAGPHTGDLWYDTANGNQVSQWNGSAWVAYQYGTAAIGTGAITASQIAANTITAAQLAAGIVYAGIVNSTTVNAATFTGSIFQGTDFVINSSGAFFYSGTPAAGNLILSIAQAAGTDAHGNTYPGGLTVGLNSSTQMQLVSNSGVGQLEFLLNSSSFKNGVMEGAIVGSFADMVLNGPASTVAGFKDFVGVEMNSSDGISSLANMEFVYTNTSGGASVIGSYNGNGWSLGATNIAGLTVTSGATVSGGLATDTLTVGGSSNTGTPSNNNTSTNGLTDGTIHGTSGAQSTGTAHTHGAGSYAVGNGQHTHNLSSHEHAL
jgi:hypothetical protein